MKSPPRLLVILQVIFVTILWSSSWVLIERDIHQIPPLTFAGLRYSIAFLILLPGLWRHKSEVQSLSVKDLNRLAILGLDEQITALGILGLAFAAFGALLVNLKPANHRRTVA